MKFNAGSGGRRYRDNSLSSNPAALRSLAICLLAGLVAAFCLALVVGSFIPDSSSSTSPLYKRGRDHPKRLSGLRKKIGDKARNVKAAITTLRDHRHNGNNAREAQTWNTITSATDTSRSGKRPNRIAIVIPFLSSSSGDPSLPPYFDLFAQSAGGSASLVDFLIFHNGLPKHVLPDPAALPTNVKLVDLQSTTHLAELLSRVADRRTDASLQESGMDRAKLVRMIAQTIEHHPYVLVEYKPATGHIFAEYLTEYSHWGYSDLDIIWGDLPRWVTEEELNNWDIVTYGFGDQDRVYLRGQFTFHKNEDRINQLWRGCNYLSEADIRYAKLLKGDQHFKLESAEGCYSAVVLHTTDVKVKYVVKALTDAEGAGAESAIDYGLFIGLGHDRNRSVVWTAGTGETDGSKLLDLDLDWFEQEDIAHGYVDDKNALQWEIGERTKVLSYRDEYGDDGEFKKCMYWAPKTYQRDICLKDVEWFKYTVMLIDGKLYKQRFERYAFPNSIVSYPFFHFQEWKRYFRRSQLSTVEGRMSVPDLAGWVVNEDGAIPVPQRSISQHHSSATIRLSKLSETQNQKLLARSGNDKGSESFLPGRKYCLRFSPQKIGGGKPSAVMCDLPVSWRDEESVMILAAGEKWEGETSSDVTLALTVQMVLTGEEKEAKTLTGLLDVAEASMAAWSAGPARQPSILLIHIAGATSEIAQMIHKRFYSNGGKKRQPEKSFSKNCLIAAIFSEQNEAVSRNTLLNMAAEAAGTRFVITGLEVERGLMISKEASLFVRRMADTYADVAGGAFVLPQFGTNWEVSSPNEASMSVKDVLSNFSVLRGDLSSLDCVKCADTPGAYKDKHINDLVMRKIANVWKDLTKSEFGENEKPEDNAAHAEVAESESISLLLVQLLQRGHSKSLRHFDQSPIIMLDSLGPIDGSMTSQLVPASEELAGSKCYNGLRLSQLATLGYNIGVVPGAFAFSTEATRLSVCPESTQNSRTSKVLGSRCSSCFMYEDEDVLKELAMDERARIADATSLWRDMEKRDPATTASQ